MKKSKKILYLVIFLLIIGVCAGGYYYRNWTQEQKAQEQQLAAQQALDGYKQSWKDLFRNYQDTAAKLPNKGDFDFRIALSATGDLSQLNEDIKSSGINAFGSGFQSLVFKLKGKYDFSDIKKFYIASTFKIYFNNSVETGTGDLDLVFKISADGRIVYAINSLDRILLKNFGLEESLVEDMYQIFGESKGKQFTYQVPQEVMNEIVSTLQSSSESSPLYQNSKEQEKAIIDSFLSKDVWSIMTGSTSSDGSNTLVGELNTDNMITFMNDVSKIIASGDDVKNFDADKETFRQFTMGGKMVVKDKNLVTSSFATEIPIKSTNKYNSEEDVRLLILDSTFKMPSPDVFDMSLDNTLYRKDNTDNKITLSIKGMIK